MLEIVGGTYIESCIEPPYNKLFGSGLRAVLALSRKEIDINFHSCVSDEHISYFDYLKKNYPFTVNLYSIPQTIEWRYYHPLDSPIDFFYKENIVNFPVVNGDNILYYGMLETLAEVHSDYLVYDPQNHIGLKETGSTFNHLALILNKKEALLLSKLESTNLIEIGQYLLQTENAEVVVIKNGVNGALVFEGSEVHNVPVFKTERVWPIGSGDIFSAVFAYEWMIKKNNAYESALYASKGVAQYCESGHLPLRDNYRELEQLTPPKEDKKIYLAGPFFSFGERFTINQFRNALISFGLKVFSPMHDSNILNENYTKEEASEIAQDDLKHIDDCDAVMAIVTGLDSGTLFEIGYAKSLEKQIIVFCENVKRSDLVMLIGSDIEITDDLSTAIYKVSW